MGSIGCVRCKKSKRDIVARTFALVAPVQYVLQQGSCSYETIPNAPKYYETDRNISLGSNGVDEVCWLRKITTRLRGTNICINYTSYVFQQVSCSYETIPNAPKYYETHRNIGLGSNGVDWLRLLWKIPTWLRGTNFCNNCTSSTHFAPSFMQLRNDPKCIQTLWNIPKHEFSVQWGGSSAFVVKNDNVTSWHELLY
jgi:hypothetical protein